MGRDRRPLPVQLRDDLRELIRTLRLGPGDQLPTEADLAERFDVGRTTIREALKLLEQDGVLDVRHGRGRFVTAQPGVERPITRLEGVTEMMAGLGRPVTNRVLSLTEGPASTDEVEALALPPGSTVVRLERARLQGDEPLIYSVDVLPRGFIPAGIDAVDWSGALLDLLERWGHHIASATAQIRVAPLPAGVARRIGIDRRGCWLLMVHRNLTSAGTPVVYSHDYYRGDEFAFNVLRRRGA